VRIIDSLFFTNPALSPGKKPVDSLQECTPSPTFDIDEKQICFEILPGWELSSRKTNNLS